LDDRKGDGTINLRRILVKLTLPGLVPGREVWVL
jgi:hypothetical protein